MKLIVAEGFGRYNKAQLWHGKNKIIEDKNTFKFWIVTKPMVKKFQSFE